MKTVKFFQIAGTHKDLFGLDGNGRVWKCSQIGGKFQWEQLEAPLEGEVIPQFRDIGKPAEKCFGIK